MAVVIVGALLIVVGSIWSKRAQGFPQAESAKALAGQGQEML
jgi:hypothetical protein